MDFTPNPRALPTGVTGTRGPENVDSERVIADIAEDIYWYMPSAYPFQTLSRKLTGKRTVTQRQFDWFQKDEYPRNLELTAASTAADTTIDVSLATAPFSSTRFMYRNTRTGELVLVTSGAATVTITVTRGFAGSVAQDMEIGDILSYVASVYEDGEGKGTFKSTKEQRDYNYCQIVKTPYGWTGRQLHTDMYGGSDVDSERKFQSIEHAKSLEKLLWFGGRSTQTGSGGHELTTSGGVLSFLQSNIWNLNGTRPTERSFVEFLSQAMKYGKGGNLNGSSKKFLFASAPWVTEIEFFAKDKLRYSPEAAKIGLKALEYETAHGTVFVVPSHVFDENHPDMAVLADLNHIRLVRHQGRDTKIMKDIQANDIDGKEELIQTDGSVEVSLEGAHAILKGLDV